MEVLNGMKYKQTDEYFNDNINKYGCLYFSLMDIAEEYTGHNFIPKTIKKLYAELVNLDLMRRDCYILNHEKVLQQALEVLSCHDKASYTGARYINHRVSWGEHIGMYMVLQFKTKNGNGHFRRAHYDPYLPKIKFSNLMSLRFYNIGV